MYCIDVYTCKSEIAEYHSNIGLGSNNYSLMWVPMDGSSSAAVNQASQAMAASGGIVWPGPISLPTSSTPPTATPATATTGTLYMHIYIHCIYNIHAHVHMYMWYAYQCTYTCIYNVCTNYVYTLCIMLYGSYIHVHVHTCVCWKLLGNLMTLYGTWCALYVPRLLFSCCTTDRWQIQYTAYLLLGHF